MTVGLTVPRPPLCRRRCAARKAAGADIRRGSLERQKDWKKRNRPWRPCKSLKLLKTAKGLLGKAWRKKGQNWKYLTESMEKFARGARATATSVSGGFRSGRLPSCPGSSWASTSVRDWKASERGAAGRRTESAIVTPRRSLKSALTRESGDDNRGCYPLETAPPPPRFWPRPLDAAVLGE